MSSTTKAYKIHFVGIGGIGMSGIAEIFLSQGHVISGSDVNFSEITERLVRMGAEIFMGHKEDQVKDVDVVVISSAVKENNPEVLAARKRGIPVIPRAEMLAETMRGKVGLAIAGTHGKTTTTSMAAQILMKAGTEPTVVVGGKVEVIGSNAKVGTGKVVVVEADESDGSFHFLPATYSVVTNIDSDHMEYFKTRENLLSAFVQFTKKTPFFGCNWLCGDDAGVKEILPRLTKPYHTYGFEIENDLVAKEVVVHSDGIQSFEVWFRKSRELEHALLGEIELSVLGRHNILNALGAIGISMSAGVNFSAAQEALSQFKHVRRRFDERYFLEKENIRVIDDYGHHPTEIKAVLATAKQACENLGHKRIITVFQPHRFTRTQNCWQDFLSCFTGTDVLIMLPVYAASEEPIEGVTSSALLRNIKLKNEKITVIEALDLAEASKAVCKNITTGDLILTLGAGTITQLAGMLEKAIPSAASFLLR